MNKETLLIIAVIVIFLLYPISWITGSYFEAQSYNKLSGKSATTWDAMWLELRGQ